MSRDTRTNLELLRIVREGYESCYKDWTEHMSKYNCEKCESGLKAQCEKYKAYEELRERLEKQLKTNY